MVKTKYHAMSQPENSRNQLQVLFHGLHWNCSNSQHLRKRLRCEAIGNVPTNWTKLPSILTASYVSKNHSRCSYNDFALLNNSMKEAEAEQQGLEDLNEENNIDTLEACLNKRRKLVNYKYIPCIDLHICIKCLFSYESYSAQIWTHLKTLTEGLFDSSKSRSLTVV